MNSFSEITLDEIAAIESIGVRSINVCGRGKLLTLQAILDYWYTHKTFLRLTNCGDKTESELTAICDKYSNASIMIGRKMYSITEVVATFDPSKKVILNRHISFYSSTLDSPVKYAIARLLGEKQNAWELTEMLYCNESRLKQRSGIAMASLPQLLKFRMDITSFVSILYQAEPSQFTIEYTKQIISIYYPEQPDKDDMFFEQLLDSNGKIKLFKLIDLLVRSRRLFAKNEKAVFPYVYTLTSKQLDECANEIALTKTRILQIKALLEDNLKSYFPFLDNMSLNVFSFTDIELSGDLIILDEKFALQNNEHAGVNFNAALYGAILSIFVAPTHQLLTERIEIFPESKRKSRKKLHWRYLIKNELFTTFNFNAFLNVFDGVTRERRFDEVTVSLLTWLEEFGIHKQDQRFSRIKSICEMIILHEYNLVLAPEGNWLLGANSRRTLVDAIYEVLNEVRKISTLESITALLTEKFPALKFTENSVRSTMLGQKSIFIAFSRTATYGLKKWEQEDPSIKGGTMRDIVNELLEKSPAPMHMNDVFTYILQFRETSRHNMRVNLKDKREDRFVFFDGGYIGLKSKKYLTDGLLSNQ